MPFPNRALRFHSTGDPASTLVLDSIVTPDPAPGQVTVKIHFAPVHPADLNTITGTYGTKPDLPATPGTEGFGEIVAAGDVGPNGSPLAPGTPVILRHRAGSWQDFVTVDAASVTPIPSGLDPHQASMLKINPVTAWRLLHERVDLAPGESVAQNAANSAVGTALIQIARHLSIPTLNIVRSESAAQTCRDAGAEHIIIDDETPFTDRALELTGGDRPKLGCNAVGGSAAIRLMDLLAPSGTMVTYGAMSRQALKVPNSFLIFKDLTLCGLWVTRWIDSAPEAEWIALIDKLAALMLSGDLHIPVAKVYPADDFQSAIAHASEDQRNGKVLLDFS